ncbi:adenosylcobinamide-GDP ribazoletransferase [Pseudogulbenkiania sp. MAI-1]|uniref:adenosylcobinamide-GDP ribazoletransferase n=1 Tax=Pseudogulbenkiania sp. MAI-1 TaxID=990370 RepID=UPI00045E7405|nr:adenosylcobinamide-GDP ribazoletransferase [Pseudogulbenkiania sp. MAI-1]
MRGLILALQFLTRLPTPTLKEFRAEWLADSARWFAVVGMLIGALLAAALWLGARVDPWLGALAALGVWVWVTGGLHLDGLADLADGLGAAHRSRERLLEVMKDPHLGSFGVIALVLALTAKLVLLMLLAKAGAAPWGLLLIPAWARLGAVWWSATLPPLAPGSAALFAGQPDRRALTLGAAVLVALSALLAPALLLAPPALWGWRRFLAQRVGGMNGDCLGAGVEATEIALLIAAVVLPALPG